MYWLGLRPGDVHLNISSPGWAKHAWSLLLRAVDRRGDDLRLQLRALRRRALLDQLRTHEVTSFCAPPTVWRMLINADLSGESRQRCARSSVPASRSTPRSSPGREGLGAHLRDGYGQTETTRQSATRPGRRSSQGSMGRPLPGMPVVLVDPTGERVEGAGEGEICFDLVGSGRCR
jgi:acetyl-CoA synthetase